MTILKYVTVVALVMAVVLTINYAMSGNDTLTASTVLTVKEMKSLYGGVELNHRCKLAVMREDCYQTGQGCEGVLYKICMPESLWNCVLDYQYHAQPECVPPNPGPPCSYFNYACIEWYIGK